MDVVADLTECMALARIRSLAAEVMTIAMGGIA